MDAESKVFQDNFTCLPQTERDTFMSDSSSIDYDDRSPRACSESYDNIYSGGNFSPNEVTTSSMKGLECKLWNQMTPSCCLVKTEDGVTRSTGRKYSHRRATTERRNRINERERDRMHQLCDAFERLRTVLPYKRAKRGPNRQKMSKIATLLLAQNYIRTLEDMLRRPTEYTNSNASAVATTNAVSQAFASTALPVVESYSSCAVAAAAAGAGGGMYDVHGIAQEMDASQYYYMHGYHDYHSGRVLPVEHAYPFL